MHEQADYALLDQPELLQFIFHPRPDQTSPPPGSSDHMVVVAKGVSISCRFYPAGQSAPTILYFHGNGEVVADHDWIAPMYNQLGANLFVADYRGYGASGGEPTFSDMIADAHAICGYLREMLAASDHSGSLFVMGRSLGSHSAVELAYHYPDRFKGLIAESGFANASRLFRIMGFPTDPSRLQDLEAAILAKLQSITLPVLVIHGDSDVLVPPSEATHFYRNVGSSDKRLVTIEGAGHNDILLLGLDEYLSSIRDFISRHG